MSQQSQDKWDARYRQGAYAEREHASAYLTEPRVIAHLTALQRAGDAECTAADLACGRGRNARHLAQLGFSVDAFDISPVGLQLAAEHSAGLSINYQQRDLIGQGLPADSRYHVIIMVRFVAAELAASLARHLYPGGVLLIEEHLRWSGDQPLAGPRSEQFRVAPGELAKWAADLQIIDHYEGLVDEPDGATAALARVLAVRFST